MSKFWEMKNKKYYSLALAVLLFSLLSQNMHHDASALIQRDMSVYNNNHITASYGASKICGLSIYKSGYVSCFLGKPVKLGTLVQLNPQPQSIPPGWQIIPCSLSDITISPNRTFSDNYGNMWYHYCGKYNDVQTHSDVNVQEEQNMQKLVVSRAFFFIINSESLPDSALASPATNSRIALTQWLGILFNDINQHHYNFAINHAANYANSVNTLITDPQYQPKVKSLFNDIKLMAINEARP